MSEQGAKPRDLFIFGCQRAGERVAVVPVNLSSFALARAIPEAATFNARAMVSPTNLDVNYNFRNF